jgi:hypothetical protein
MYTSSVMGMHNCDISKNNVSLFLLLDFIIVGKYAVSFLMEKIVVLYFFIFLLYL